MFTKHNADKYADFVDHPRYGRRPKVTGLNPDTKYGGDTFIHWHSPKDCRNVWEAIEADKSDVWSELKSRDVDALIDELVKYKRKQYPRDMRRIAVRGPHCCRRSWPMPGGAVNWGRSVVAPKFVTGQPRCWEQLDVRP